jgi:hypothetical protein
VVAHVALDASETLPDSAMYMSSVACVDADTDVGTAGVVVGVLLVVGTILTPLPQFAKILRHNSADGVSLPTLSFIVAYQAACAAGIVQRPAASRAF